MKEGSIKGKKLKVVELDKPRQEARDPGAERQEGTTPWRALKEQMLDWGADRKSLHCQGLKEEHDMIRAMREVDDLGAELWLK